MAKRFTDNEKWKKTFFKSLSTVNKLFFLYILDECDNAGVWHVESDIAEIRIGEKIDLKTAKKELGKHIYEFDNSEKWFIPFFIDFQYGVLNEKVNAHKSVIDKLKKRKLTKTYQQFTNCLIRDKNKAKDKDMDKVKNKYGEYNNVLLTKIECDKLVKKFGGQETLVKIDNLDFKIEQKGYKYKSHYLTILDWDRRDKKKNPKQKKIIGYRYECPNCKKNYDKSDRRDYHYRCEENKCQEIPKGGGMVGHFLEWKENIYKE